jgi:hypothetical protein
MTKTKQQPQSQPLLNPLEDSIFQWSSFSKKFCDLGKDFPIERSEYKNAKEATERIRSEDGERAFDTGQIMRKMLFGIYDDSKGHKIQFSAAKWNHEAANLIGAATIKDWEWEQYTEEEEENFTEKNVLARLSTEVEEITDWLNSAKT